MTQSISKAFKLISQNRLLECMAVLREFALQNRDSALKDKIERIEQNYSFLLKYLKDGANDPSREKMFNDIRYQLYCLLCNLMSSEEKESNPKLFYSTLRTVSFSNLNFGDALGRYLSADAGLQLTGLYDENGMLSDDAKKILNEKDRAIKDLFSVVWTLPVGDSSQLEAIVNVASDNDISYQLRGTIVAALTMGLMNTYDAKKIEALLDIDSRTSDPRIRARALTGVVLALAHYENFLAPDYSLKQRFEVWSDDITNYTRLREVVYSIVKARGSGKLTARINAEIMPGIASLGKDFFKDLQKRDTPITLEELQENPEWEKAMRESGLDKKLRKLQNMHEKGADMMLPMFNQLANDYFFKDIDVWFRPFDIWEARRNDLDSDLTEILTAAPQSALMCDADKFAFMLYLGRVKGPAKDMMTNAFRLGKEEMSEQMKEKELLSSEPEFETEVSSYARSLYRFFNFFRARKEFFNPFESAISFGNLPYIGGLLSEDEILQALGEAYFQQGFYSDAVSIFKQLTSTDAQSASLAYQKIGYCYEKDKKYESALDNYLKADTIKTSEDIWLLERIYRLARLTGRKDIMFEKLELLMESDRENLTYLKDWITEMLNQDVYRSHPEKIEKFEKALSKLTYLSQESPELTSLQAKAAASKGDWKQVKELLSSRLDDVEMYLAGNSLGGEKGAGHDREAEKSMSDDLFILANAFAATDEYAEATASLKMMRMLDPSFNPDEMALRMKSLWLASEELSGKTIYIPMLMEASAI